MLPLDGVYEEGLALCVERGGGLVQQQHGRVAHEGPSQRQPRLLTPGQAAAVRSELKMQLVDIIRVQEIVTYLMPSYLSVESLGQGLDKLECVRVPGCPHSIVEATIRLCPNTHNAK